MHGPVSLAAVILIGIAGAFIYGVYFGIIYAVRRFCDRR